MAHEVEVTVAPLVRKMKAAIEVLEAALSEADCVVKGAPVRRWECDPTTCPECSKLERALFARADVPPVLDGFFETTFYKRLRSSTEYAEDRADLIEARDLIERAIRLLPYKDLSAIRLQLYQIVDELWRRAGELRKSASTEPSESPRSAIPSARVRPVDRGAADRSDGGDMSQTTHPVVAAVKARRREARRRFEIGDRVRYREVGLARSLLFHGEVLGRFLYWYRVAYDTVTPLFPELRNPRQTASIGWHFHAGLEADDTWDKTRRRRDGEV